jgi:branched-chain amino acid transport system ATP-binding protein
MALPLKPRLPIANEPLQGLAPLIVTEVFRIIAQERISILQVEQNVRMSRVSDLPYLLENGRMVYSGPAAEPRAA